MPSSPSVSRMSSGGQLEDGLATEYELSGTTATLTLREDVTFHDGSDFTAEDFRATFRRAVGMGLLALYVGLVGLGYEQALPRLRRLASGE